jgi:hypothetical protein
VTPALSRALAMAALVLVPLAGCAPAPPTGEEPRTPTPSGSPTLRTPRPWDPPGPTPGQAVVEDSLAILGGERTVVERAVAPFGGDVVEHVEETDTYVVRFDVRGITELIALRDELREAGLDARLIPVLPTLEG